MLRKKIAGWVFAGALTSGLLSAADVFVRMGPPPVVVERRGPPPERGYVWVPGYQRWNGNAYVWEPGRWERPPRPRARWIPHRWKHQRGGWIFVEGHWRWGATHARGERGPDSSRSSRLKVSTTGRSG